MNIKMIYNHIYKEYIPKFNNAKPQSLLHQPNNSSEELYRNDLNDLDNHSDMITHLEPDILECKIKWALGSITMNKASGGDGILPELLQILKDDAVKVLHSIHQQVWKIQQWPQDWKKCFHSNPKEGQCQRMFKLPHSCTHFTH